MLACLMAGFPRIPSYLEFSIFDAEIHISLV